MGWYARLRHWLYHEEGASLFPASCEVCNQKFNEYLRLRDAEARKLRDLLHAQPKPPAKEQS